MKQITTSFAERNKAEVAKLNESTARHLFVRMGEHFLKTKENTNGLVDAWSRGAKEFTKKEFRQNICNLIDTNRAKTNPIEIDALFDELEGHGGDMLDVRKVKQAFKTYHDGAVAAADERAATRAKADKYMRCADAAMRAIETTLAYERERDRVDGCDSSLRDRLELKLARKALKASDLVAKFGDLSGSFTKTSFLNMVVTILGMYDAREEDVSTLFIALDADGGGALDAKQMKAVLQGMIAAGKKGVELNEKMEEALLVQLDGVYTAQRALRAMLDEDAATTAAEERRRVQAEVLCKDKEVDVT